MGKGMKGDPDEDEKMKMLVQNIYKELSNHENMNNLDAPTLKNMKSHLNMCIDLCDKYLGIRDKQSGKNQ